MEEININERTQNVKIKGILNNTSSRSRRDSSSFKHVVFVEPKDMKRESVDSDNKRKIKIKKIVNKKNKLSNKKIIIKKTKQLSDNNVNLLNNEQNNTIKINKIIMKKKYSKINPIEKNFQLFQKGYLIFNIIGIILGIFLMYHIYNLFLLFSIFNNMYMYLSTLEVIILFTIFALNINLCKKLIMIILKNLIHI